ETENAGGRAQPFRTILERPDRIGLRQSVQESLNEKVGDPVIIGLLRPRVLVERPQGREARRGFGPRRHEPTLPLRRMPSAILIGRKEVHLLRRQGKANFHFIYHDRAVPSGIGECMVNSARHARASAPRTRREVSLRSRPLVLRTTRKLRALKASA